MNKPDQASPAVGPDAIILVVDDVSANRHVLAGLLRKAGYQVLTAPTAPLALQQLSMQVPDLIMLDIMMPGMDGYALCRKLQSEPATAKVPIIFLSALFDALDKVKAFESGGADYVTKPYQAEEVLARVAHQIKIARLQRALEREKTELVRKNEQLLTAQRQTASVFSALSETLLGLTIDGKYRIEAKIGSGGFGVVYRATHLGLQRPVAVKVFRPPTQASKQEALTRFQLEGISACRVNHPSAVAILDSGIAPQGIAYLVMELLQGPTLYAELLQKRWLSVQRCMQIVVPLCDVLIAAHAAGIIHRDIKPENIMLAESLQGEIVKVLDFGIAKILGGEPNGVTPVVTAQTDFVGTPVYTAPERLNGDEYDGRSDVFSIGVLLHEMLTGQLPFPDRDQNAFKIMFNHLHGIPTPLRKHMPQLPEPLEAILLRVLCRDKAARPTAKQLRDELVVFLSSRAPDAGAPASASKTAVDRGTQITEAPAALAQQWLGGDSDPWVEIAIQRPPTPEG